MNYFVIGYYALLIGSLLRGRLLSASAGRSSCCSR